MMRITHFICLCTFIAQYANAQKEYWMRGYEYHFNSTAGRDFISRNRIATLEVTDAKPQDENLKKVRHRFYFNEIGLMTNRSTYFNQSDTPTYFIYYYYNEQKRLSRMRYFVKDTLRGERNYKYDDYNRLVEEVYFRVYRDYYPAGGYRYEWVNDSVKVKINIRNGKQEIFKYDRYGGLKEYIKADTVRPVNYYNYYNMNGRRIKTVSYNTLGEEYGMQHFDYDGNNRLVRAALNEVEYLFFFDENGFLKEERKVHKTNQRVLSATYKYTYW